MTSISTTYFVTRYENPTALSWPVSPQPMLYFVSTLWKPNSIFMTHISNLSCTHQKYKCMKIQQHFHDQYFYNLCCKYQMKIKQHVMTNISTTRHFKIQLHFMPQNSTTYVLSTLWKILLLFMITGVKLIGHYYHAKFERSRQHSPWEKDQHYSQSHGWPHSFMTGWTLIMTKTCMKNRLVALKKTNQNTQVVKN